VPDEIWQARSIDTTVVEGVTRGFGREMFSMFRALVSHAEQGAMPFGDMDPDEAILDPTQDQALEAAEADA
jgi:hypothetical protein